MIRAAVLIKIFLVILFVYPFVLFSEIPLFLPPKDWKESPLPEHLPRIKIGFLAKTQLSLSPSINLAEEKTSLSIQSYLKQLQEIYTQNPMNRWQKMGTIQTKAGTAYITLLDTSTSAGTARILQSIFIKHDTVYILTGAVAQKDFGQYQDIFLESFRSFSLVESLEDVIECPKKKAQLQQKTHQYRASPTKKMEKALLAYLRSSFSEQGSYWQLLILKQAMRGQNTE